MELVQRFDPKAANYDHIDIQTFQRMLASAKGAKMVTLTGLTIPEYRKIGCPWKNNLLKLARVNGVVNWNYERAVNRQRTREGVTPDFEALPRRWGTRLHGLPFVSHVNKKGEYKLYLEIKIQNVYGVEYRTLDGETISVDEIKPFLIEKEKNHRQGIEEEVILRDYCVENLISIVINGHGYVIMGN